MFHLYEHLVSLKVPWLTKEPGSVHVDPPGCATALRELAKLIGVALVDSIKVLHQQVVNLFCVFFIVIIMGNTGKKCLKINMKGLLHGASVEHTAWLALPRHSPHTYPLVLEVWTRGPRVPRRHCYLSWAGPRPQGEHRMDRD